MKNLERASGVLLHITSLPSPFGIGDLGPYSYHFVNLLSKAKQRYWNILPATATCATYAYSPYQPTSAFAGNTLLISPEQLAKEGLLLKAQVDKLKLPQKAADFDSVAALKAVALQEAWRNFSQIGRNADFEGFCAENAAWLDDYALFKALREESKCPWYHWPQSLQNREPPAMARKRVALKNQLEEERFAQ